MPAIVFYLSDRTFFFSERPQIKAIGRSVWASYCHWPSPARPCKYTISTATPSFQSPSTLGFLRVFAKWLPSWSHCNSAITFSFSVHVIHLWQRHRDLIILSILLYLIIGNYPFFHWHHSLSAYGSDKSPFSHTSSRLVKILKLCLPPSLYAMRSPYF